MSGSFHQHVSPVEHRPYVPCFAVCGYVRVCGEFPGECDITQRGLLLGVLLLLPATPLLESMILHTHTLAPTEVTPRWAKFPLAPPVSENIYVYTCVCVCVRLLSACLPAD